MTHDKYEALKRSMEAALADDPDDLGTHSAYADLLAENSDPPPDPSDGVPEGDHSVGLGPLAQSTVLGNVRHFRLGPAWGFGDRCWIHRRLVVEVLKRMPKLEEMLVYAKPNWSDGPFSFVAGSRSRR